MAFLSLNSYDTPGLAPRMNVLFWGPGRLSSKLLKQGCLVERLKSSFRKFYGRYGDLIQQYEVSLSRMLNDILTLDQQWPSNQLDFPPISWPWYRLWPSPNYEWFPRSICNGCGIPAGNAYPSGHLVPSPILGLANASIVETNSSNLPCLYSTFHLEYPLVLSRFCIVVISGIPYYPWLWPVYKSNIWTFIHSFYSHCYDGAFSWSIKFSIDNFFSAQIDWQNVELVVQFPARGSTEVSLCLFPCLLWLWHFLYSVGPRPVSSLHIYTLVSRAFIAGVASQAGDAYSSWAPGLTFCLQGSVNVHPGALLMVSQWQCISPFFIFHLFSDSTLGI